MHIHKLTIAGFKNHGSASFEFCPEINCLYGANGVGKTNVLDAIYFLGAGRSYFTRNDQQCIPFDEDFARWHGDFTHEEANSNHLVVIREAGKKTIERNGSLVRKLSDFVARVPVVIITPGDIELITGNSDERRRLIDRTLAIVDGAYLSALQRYNRLLLHRNELLKKFGLERRTDMLALESLDVQMIPEADLIYEKRKDFVSQMAREVVDVYAHLSDGVEAVDFQYESNLHEHSMANVLKQSLQKDLMAQRTTRGIHRDDIDLTINSHSVKKYASQGQIKTMTISIHLATYRLLQTLQEKTPILLLDDIYEKIDENRASNLMSLIAGTGYGQIIITDTSEERMRIRLEDIKAEKKFFNIEHLIKR